VRDLRGVIEPEEAPIGVLISMESPTKPMLKGAAEAGFYKPSGLEDRYPRIQILIIEELLAGKRVEYPRLLEARSRKRRKPGQRRRRRRSRRLSPSKISCCFLSKRAFVVFSFLVDLHA
jgi:hypothetical protein